jgi:hypothetical protein
MKTRSSLEICLPLVLCAAACVASLPMLILSLVWLTLGVCSIGYRSLRELPTEGISRQWLSGPRSIVLWFYHLAWWPWYMRFELREIAARTRLAIETSCRRMRRKGSLTASKQTPEHDDQ